MPPNDTGRIEEIQRWYRTSLIGHPAGCDFRRLWVGDSISQLGTQVGSIALPLLAVTVLDADEFQMGLLVAFETIAFLLVGLPAGAWVDRMRKRNVLVAGDVARGIALLILPVGYLVGVLSFPILLAVAGVVGVATVFFDVAYQSYLPALVPVDRISEGNAKLQVSQSAAQVIGPGIGGALVRLVGAPLVIFVDAASFLISMVFTLRITHREVLATKQGRRSLAAEIGEGLAFVIHQPLLRRIVATTGICNLFATISQAMLVLFAIRDLGIGEAGLGVALGIGAIGGLAGAFAAETVIRVVGEGRSIAMSLLPTLVTGTLVPLSLGSPQVVAISMLAVSMAVFGFGTVVYNVAQVSFRQRVCPRRLLGRMNASVRFIVWGTMPIGALLGAVIGGHYGAVTALWVAVAGQVFGVLPVLLSPLRRMRELPSAQDLHVQP